MKSHDESWEGDITAITREKPRDREKNGPRDKVQKQNKRKTGKRKRESIHTMPQNTIERIEARIRSGKVSEENKVKLLALVERLKKEIGSLSESDGERALKIAKLAEESSVLAVGEERDPETLRFMLETLGKTVGEFNVTHPRLVSIVNELSLMLASIGI